MKTLSSHKISTLEGPLTKARHLQMSGNDYSNSIKPEIQDARRGTATITCPSYPLAADAF